LRPIKSIPTTDIRRRRLADRRLRSRERERLAHASADAGAPSPTAAASVFAVLGQQGVAPERLASVHA